MVGEYVEVLRVFVQLCGCLRMSASMLMCCKYLSNCPDVYEYVDVLQVSVQLADVCEASCENTWKFRLRWSLKCRTERMWGGSC